MYALFTETIIFNGEHILTSIFRSIFSIPEAVVSISLIRYEGRINVDANFLAFVIQQKSVNGMLTCLFLNRDPVVGLFSG